ncbi:unnamed protein product [Clonostachys rhizophaga]|uniref:DUF6546 domain-containing protein n=1 Tax=Clonostachys rhizophaga TaxID=160324 RepID=A0A9N9VEJ0_9HYPO|nr:unnamed protein product [Clonostachys rhizophaga]
MQPSAPSTTRWASLPTEIRQQILSHVGLPILWERNSNQSPPRVARFATICREWQVFFEACTFRRLVLNTENLECFNMIIRRDSTRLKYTRNIWLRIQLPHYSCPKCEVPEDEFEKQINNVIFTYSIRSLLETLKLWDPAKHGAKGLALMVSAMSPDDTSHRLIIGDMQPNYPFHPAEDPDVPPGIADVHSYYHRRSWCFLIHDGHLPSRQGGHIKRMQGTPLRFEPIRNETDRFNGEYINLPAVPMIKGLVMRKQHRREIDTRSLACLLSRSLISLEWFRLERTIHADILQQLCFELGFQTHLLTSLPKTLRQFSFVQWKIPSGERRDVRRGVGTVVTPYSLAYLPREMAKLSQRLERFCPPWQTDTAAFLQSMIDLEKSPATAGSSLKRIILRFVPTRPEASRRDFESVVVLAAKAALLLPQLEVIELWATRLEERSCDAYIFRYIHSLSRAKIVWRSPEPATEIRPRIITKWNEVAMKHAHSVLEHRVIPFSETRGQMFDSGGTFIYKHLLLKELAFDRITQIILESEIFYWHLGDPNDASIEDHPILRQLAFYTAEHLAKCIEALPTELSW